MMKCAIWNVNGTDYQLKMGVRQCVMLETKIGNPINLFLAAKKDILPALPQMVTIITHGMIMYHPGVNEAKVHQLVDQWLDEGHAIIELLEVVTELLKVSRYFPEEKMEEGILDELEMDVDANPLAE